MSYDTYHWCVVRECKNTSIKTPEKLWIKVPTNIKIRNTWLKLARRDPKSLSRKTQLYFCEDHFDVIILKSTYRLENVKFSDVFTFCIGYFILNVKVHSCKIIVCFS